MFNPFKKKKKDDKENAASQEVNKALEGVDKSKMSFKEKMALKMFQKMPQKKKEEALRKAMNPQNIMKEKDKILKQLDEAVKSGQMSKQEAEQIKGRLGLR